MIFLNMYKSLNNSYYISAIGCNNIDWVLQHPELKPYMNYDSDGEFISLEGMETLGKIALCSLSKEIFLTRVLAEYL